MIPGLAKGTYREAEEFHSNLGVAKAFENRRADSRNFQVGSGANRASLRYGSLEHYPDHGLPRHRSDSLAHEVVLMHPFLHFVLQGALTLSNPAPVDSVIWAPLYYDGWYATPNGGPTWSPDDEQLAFSYFDYTPPQYFRTTLEILQSDETWRHCPLTTTTSGGAAWSPLGGEIAVTNLATIVLFAASDCSYIREIAGGYDPKWSGDGQRIVFSDGAIYTAAAAGGDVRHVVDDGIQPDWSPDGTSVVFVRDKDLWTVSIDGTHQRQITQSGQDEWPAWSRDGSWIAFTRRDPQGECSGVWLVGANGGLATQVTPVVEGEDRARPCWSRDGTRLTYFVLNERGGRIGVGILRDVIPLAVQSGTWSTAKKKYH